MSQTVSANLDSKVASKARLIAQKENRSVSNFVAGAITVFSDFPKELRDFLLEVSTSNDKELMDAVTLEMARVAVRKRFDLAADKVASELVVEEDLKDASDLEILEAATRMTKGA